MTNPERFYYTTMNSQSGEAAFVPQLPLSLAFRSDPVAVLGLLDTGATVNVLPYSMGLALGATWQPRARLITLTGNLGSYEAQPLIVMASVGPFPPTRLAFAWTKASDVPLILGQVNFFMEFDVCFYRSEKSFEVRPKS